MVAPIFMVVGLVNILAQNLNYNINRTRNDGMDIRVRRHAEIPQIPLDVKNYGNTERIIDVETPIILRKLKGSKFRPKRDLYPNNVNKPSGYYYNSVNENRYNAYNGNINGYNANNGVAGDNYNANNEKIVSARWKSTPNFFVRAYSAVTQSLGYTTTPAPYRYNSYNGNYYSGLNTQSQYPSTNNFKTTHNGNNDSHIYQSNGNKYYNNLPYKPIISQNSYNNFQPAARNSYNYYNNVPINTRDRFNATIYNKSNDGSLLSYSNTQNTAMNNNTNLYNSQTFYPQIYNQSTHRANLPSYGTNNSSTNHSNNIYNTPTFNPETNTWTYNQPKERPALPYDGNTYYNNLPTFRPPYDFNGPRQNVTYNHTPPYTKYPPAYNGTNENRRRRVKTTTERIEAACILCSTFSCPENQKRVGFSCVAESVEDEDEYVDIE